MTPATPTASETLKIAPMLRGSLVGALGHRGARLEQLEPNVDPREVVPHRKAGLVSEDFEEGEHSHG